jgi:hypothetical protein
VKAGLPTRNPKERPARLELAVYETSDDPHPAKRLVPIDEYPFSLALLRCSKYPGAMLGEPHRINFTSREFGRLSQMIIKFRDMR